MNFITPVSATVESCLFGHQYNAAAEYFMASINTSLLKDTFLGSYPANCLNSKKETLLKLLTVLPDAIFCLHKANMDK